MTATYTVPGAVLIEREHTVPLDHDRPEAGSIVVFTREVAAPEGRDRPYLVFFQGGPGYEARRPTSPPSGWIKKALADFRVLLLDQRGTGRSTPVGVGLPGDDARGQADYLTHFRADSIVRDAELIRQELGVDRWSILGQSFGGFCSMTYLSFAPEGLREVMITGGLSPVGRPVDDVYSATWRRTIEKNRAYFARYPDDRGRVGDILRRLGDEDLRLPNGDRLTARRFRQLGGFLGNSLGFENLHHILELPFGSSAFLHDVETGSMHFARNPIYATVHEACYADGGATRWSAERMMPPEVEAEGYLSAEHVFSWMFEDYGALRPHREAAHILAEHEWPRLYDPAVLAQNEVPVAGTAYYDDPYVVREFAMETAAAIRGLRPWITNEYEHNGLSADDRVFSRLLDMVRGRA
jgi:pimeloyl-ACP methyl ester carboxylesterase